MITTKAPEDLDDNAMYVALGWEPHIQVGDDRSGPAVHERQSRHLPARGYDDMGSCLLKMPTMYLGTHCTLGNIYTAGAYFKVGQC